MQGVLSKYNHILDARTETKMEPICIGCPNNGTPGKKKTVQLVTLKLDTKLSSCQICQKLRQIRKALKF